VEPSTIAHRPSRVQNIIRPSIHTYIHPNINKAKQSKAKPRQGKGKGQGPTIPSSNCQLHNTSLDFTYSSNLCLLRPPTTSQSVSTTYIHASLTHPPRTLSASIPSDQSILIIPIQFKFKFDFEFEFEFHLICRHHHHHHHHHHHNSLGELPFVPVQMLGLHSLPDDAKL